MNTFKKIWDVFTLCVFVLAISLSASTGDYTLMLWQITAGLWFVVAWIANRKITKLINELKDLVNQSKKNNVDGN